MTVVYEAKIELKRARRDAQIVEAKYLLGELAILEKTKARALERLAQLDADADPSENLPNGDRIRR